MKESHLSPNILAFLALSNEYCQCLESAAESTREAFIDTMLRLLPRLYITVSDINPQSVHLDMSYIPGALDEDYYDNVRDAIGMLMGEDDTYLEVFVDDMKYSDTPIAASISEGLADIFQELYNMLENVKDATNELILETVDIVKEDFESFWSQNLCNVLRAINAVKYK